MSAPISNKGLLVTGAAGFIGSNFCHYWLQHHPRSTLVALDALTYAVNLHNLGGLESHSTFHFVHGDVNDAELVERMMIEHQINVIVHFATESHVDRSVYDLDTFIQTTIISTHNLLRVARKLLLDDPQRHILHRFHHISTDEVYGTLGPKDPPFREDTPYAPNSPYAASKTGSDHLVRAYQHTYGLGTTTSNCSNNYGPYHFPEKLNPLSSSSIFSTVSLCPFIAMARRSATGFMCKTTAGGLRPFWSKLRKGKSTILAAAMSGRTSILFLSLARSWMNCLPVIRDG